MSKFKVDVTRGSELADTEPTRAGNEARPTQDFVTTAATIGVIAAGAALFEVALIPGMVIGGAAVLAPKLVFRRLPKLASAFAAAVQLNRPPEDYVRGSPAGPAGR